MKSEVSILAAVGALGSTYSTAPADNKNTQIYRNSTRSIGAAEFKHKKRRRKIAKISRKRNR